MFNVWQSSFIKQHEDDVVTSCLAAGELSADAHCCRSAIEARGSGWHCVVWDWIVQSHSHLCCWWRLHPVCFFVGKASGIFLWLQTVVMVDNWPCSRSFPTSFQRISIPLIIGFRVSVLYLLCLVWQRSWTLLSLQHRTSAFFLKWLFFFWFAKGIKLFFHWDCQWYVSCILDMKKGDKQLYKLYIVLFLDYPCYLFYQDPVGSFSPSSPPEFPSEKVAQFAWEDHLTFQTQGSSFFFL